MARYRVQTASGRSYDVDLSEGEDIESVVAEIERSEASVGGGRGAINPPAAKQPQPAQPIDYGDAATDMMGTPATPPAQGLIQRIGQALRPEPKSLLDQPYTPTPEEAQAERDRRLSYGAGPIRPDVLTAADKVRSTRGTQNEFRTNNPTVARVAREMDLRQEESSAGIIGRINTQANRDAALQAKSEEFRSLGEWAVDSLSGVAQGFVSLAQLPTNIIAPGSSLAESLRETQKELQAQESDVSKASREVLRRRVESEEGFLEKYFAIVKELVTNPTLSINEAIKQVPMFIGVVGGAKLGAAAGGAGVAAAGRVAPNVALADAIGGGALTASARAAGSTVGGVGASMVMAGGDAAGNTYETLTDPKKTPLSDWKKNPDYQRLLLEKLTQGRTEEQAKSLIEQIQKDAKNPKWFPEDTPGGQEYVAASKQAIEEIATTKARLIALPASLMGIFGFMGAEAAVVGRGLARAAADAMTLKGAAKLVGKDIGLEQVEEGGTQFLSNVAIRTINPNQSLMEGVPEAMATAAVTSTPFGVLGAYSQYKAAQEQGQQADPVADYLARATPGARDAAPEFISPEQTVRRPTDVGPSPLAPGVANFTPPDSPTKQAGLVDIVVPMPGAPGEEVPTVPGTINPTTEQQFGLDKLRMGGANVGTSGVLGGLAGEGSGAGGGLVGGSMGLAGPGNAGAAGPGDGLAGVPGANDRQAVPAGGAAGQQAAGVAPAKIWAGRAGDGYMQPEDARQALPGLQRKYPDLTWNLQQDADGKFFWSGTTRGDASGAAVTGAAGQGLAGVPGAGVAQQPGVAGAGVVDLGQAGGSQPGRSGGAATVGGASPDEPVFTLKLAPPAPLRAAGQAITLLKTSRGVEVELTDAANLTEQQKVASAMARLVGKTVTYMDYVSGPANKMPNGFVIPGKEQNIYLDSKSDDGALFVMMHEGVHALPQPIREKLVATIKGLTKTGMRADFAKKFGYDINNEFEVDNEIAAFMTQAVTKRKDFWQELRTKMGDGDFVEVAKVIIEKIDTFIKGAKSAYGDEFLKRYATDAVAVRDAVSTAYADAMKAQGQQAPAATDAVVASNRQVLEGARPYANAPDTLMGFRKSQPNKPFAEQSYKHVEFVRVTWPDGTSMLEAQRGLNKTHALERARRNWSDAESVIAVPREIAKGEDPTLVSDVDSMMGGGITASNRAADVDKLGMYSELARKLDAGPNQAPVDQWKAYIKGLPQKGVKPDEIEWSGVEDFLELKRAAGQKVTKAEVAEYLKQGGVKVEETVLSDDGTTNLPAGWSVREATNEDDVGYPWVLVDDSNEVRGAGNTSAEAMADGWDADAAAERPTKYSQYTLPGSENYREVLLTLPTGDVMEAKQKLTDFQRKMREKYDVALAWRNKATPAERAEGDRLLAAVEKTDTKYRSKHWDQPNVLAHIRVNDRTDKDGKKVLFVEEIQSDWGQEGKKKGFAGGPEPTITAERVGPWVPSDPNGDGKYRVYVDGVDTGFIRAESVENAIQIKRGALQNNRASVPRAPFVTKTEGWLNLALKRVMVMAAEGGYDKVAFVNGEQSADRYDLSKQIDRVVWMDNSSGGIGLPRLDGEPSRGSLEAYDLNGKRVLNEPAIEPERVEEFVGKEVAKRLFSSRPRASQRAGIGVRERALQGLDLKVGGEGMKTFYDTIVPTALKKLLPKVGGGQMGVVQVGESFDSYLARKGIEERNGELFTSDGPLNRSVIVKQHERQSFQQPGFDVTPAMREKVATSGLPMFSNRKVEEPGSAAPAEGKRVGSVDTHILAAVRGERSMADRTVLSAEEKTKIRASAAKLKVPVSELEAQVREHKAAHPVEDGWAPLTFTGVKKNEDTGKYDLQYKTVPYEFSNGTNGKALQPGTPAYQAQVDRMARGMLAAVRSVYQRALDGDAAARKIIDQSGWYKEMRTRLRQEFGGLGDLFADLLGATSPNTPVRTNWDNSVEALRLLSQGKFDDLVPQWIAWAQRVDEVETRFRAWFNDRLKDGMSKAAIKKTSEYKEFAREAAAARELPDNLMPTKANGKKFGFNGGNVVRAVVDLWRVVKNADPDINRGGTAPKAINFSGNLIGFRARATIDVWAARMLQRLAGGLRIPSMAEGGVSGQALEDGRNTLQFGFGQDVFSEAVKLIRNDPELSQDSTLNSINDDDLQALVWFIEKEVWTKGNWTSAAGEGGSFELESDLAGIRDREAVTELRRVADSSVSSTAEQRQQATADISRLRQEIENLPAIVQANEILERNAQRVTASKTAKREDKLTPAQMAEIKAENASARKAIVKARSSAAAKSIEKQIAKAQRTLKKPTVEESQATRAAAVGKLKEMARTVDRFVGGLSIQQGDQQPTDAAMAGLAKSIEDAVISVDDGATVIGLKAISTQGRYGSVERALDMEVIARAGFNARPMAAAVFTAARDANQDSAFVARVLRPDEQFDPLTHRPGIEIYFRDMKQAEEAAKMMAKIAGKRIAKATEVGPGFFEVSGYTVVVDGRRTPTTRSGAMGTPVGMRIIYMPEFEARYGSDPRLADATENNIRDIVNERADNLGNFADEVLRTFDGVSFAGRFNYEVDTRFAGEYQGAIDAYSSAAATAGTDQSRSQAWQGRPIRESVAAAVGRVQVDAGQQGGELLGGDQVRASNRIVGDGGGREDSAGPAPLPGAPVIKGATGPDPRIVAVAEQYARDNGIDLKRQTEYAQVDPQRAKRIANAYEVMRHAPENPKVKEAYENLIRQTTAQYRALEEAGYKFWFIDPENDPYKSPWDALRDLRSTQTMGVFPTAAGFGSAESDTGGQGNPMESDTGMRWPYGSPDGELRPVLANDLFRAVHDAFGHGLEGAGFREQGEENAWQAHVRLFTGSAVGAITSETRGQNSWLNYGPYGEKNRTAKVEDTIFADQKTGLMPEWTWTEGRVGDMPGITASNRAQTDTPEFRRWFGDSKVVDAEGKPLVMYRGQRRVAAPDRFVMTQGRAIPSFVQDPAVASVYSRQLDTRGYGAGSNVMPVYLSIQNPLDMRSMGETVSLEGVLRLLNWDWGVASGIDDAKPRLGYGDLADLLPYMDTLAYKTGARFEIDASDSQGYRIDSFEELANYIRESGEKNDFESIDLAVMDTTFDAYMIADSTDWIETLSKFGFDGVIHKDVFEAGARFYEGDKSKLEDGFDGPVHDTYRPFEQTQIKSATGNRGTFDPENPDIRFSNRAATTKAAPELVSIFKDLDGARGLGRIRAQERVDAHPMAETIRQIDKDFLDILERLDDAGLVKINCK